MKAAVSLVIGLFLVIGIVNALELDYVDIGDTASMTSHNAQGWVMDGEDHSGNDGNDNIAMVWGRGGVCDDSNREVTVELDAGIKKARSLIIRHYDGSGDDSFNIYVDGQYADSYNDQFPTDSPTQWRSDFFDVDFFGKRTIKLVATGTPQPKCSPFSAAPFLAQVPINWIELSTVLESVHIPNVEQLEYYNVDEQIPEFGFGAGAATLAGAIVALFFLRKHA